MELINGLLIGNALASSGSGGAGLIFFFIILVIVIGGIIAVAKCTGATGRAVGCGCTLDAQCKSNSCINKQCKS